jgi:hypothetical protein
MACRKCRKMFMVPAEIVAPSRQRPGADTSEVIDERVLAPESPPQRAAPATQYVGFNKPRAVVEEEQTNGLAIAALICGLVGLIVPLLPGVAAIALGIAAVRRTQDGRFGGQGKATAGIGLGVLSFALHGCIYTIVWPRIERATEVANRVQCASNMREIGRALLLYAKNNRGEFPEHVEQALLTSQDVKPQHFTCPSSHETPAGGSTPAEQAKSLASGGHLSYTYVARGRTKSSHGKTVLLYEPLAPHRGDGAYMLMDTGEVWWRPPRTAQLMIQELSRGNNPPHAPPGGWPDN